MHPILTHGGAQVNVIPGEARLEMYVRGKTPEGVADASRRVDRALRAGALALGARVEIDTLPGPMPLRCDPTMARFFAATARALVGPEHYRDIPHRSGCTDMGDLSQVIPALHPYMGGARGPGLCSIRWGLAITPASAPISSPAASVSVWQWPARSPTIHP